MHEEKYEVTVDPFYSQLDFWYIVLAIFIGVLCLLRIFKILSAEQARHVFLVPCFLFSGMSAVIFYQYAMELFVAYYSGAKYELEAFKLRITGPYAWVYIGMLMTPVLGMLQLIPKLRNNVSFISTCVFFALFFERLAFAVTTSLL